MNPAQDSRASARWSDGAINSDHTINHEKRTTLSPIIETSTRNADLKDLVTLLKTQQDLKLDATVPATAIHSVDGNLVVDGMSALGDSLTFRPTEICDGHLAEKLGIPVRYLRTMRETRPDLYDANVNGWLQGHEKFPGGASDTPLVRTADPDPRSFLLRTFSDPGSDEPGIARSLHSDRYGIVDNLDMLFAAMEGIKQAGVETEFTSADLSERRMTVRFAAPSVRAASEILMEGYRSPFSGKMGTDNPTVFAGFEVNTSETGGGAATIVPRLVFEICTNGMCIVKDAFRKVHLGGKMEEGIVRYSEDTRRKHLEVITAEARDTVATFLDIEYVQNAIRNAEALAGHPVADLTAAVELVAKTENFTQDEQALLLEHFLGGGQKTAGGMLNAMTSMAQVVEDPDRAYEIEHAAYSSMELLAA